MNKTKQDSYEKAITHYTRALELNPNFADAYNHRGVVKANLDRYEEAIADFDAAIQIDPQDVDAYYNRGFAKQSLGQNEEALTDFRRALALAQQQGDEELARHVETKIKDITVASADPSPSPDRTRKSLKATAGAWKGTHNPETLKQAISSDRLATSRPRPKL